MQKQLATLTALKDSESLADVTRILAQHTLDAGQFVSINYFEHTTNNQQGIRVIATANRNEAYESNEVHLVDELFIKDYRQVLEAEGDYLYANFNDIDAVPTPTQLWIKSQGIYSSYHVLLQSRGIVYGFIAFNDKKNDIILGMAERRAYRSIADEVAVILENQQLQQQHESALQETRTLYQLSNTLMYVQDIPGLLRNLKNNAIQDSTHMTLLEMSYDDNNRLQTITALYEADETRIQSVERSAHIGLSAEQLQTLQRHWKKQRERLEVTNDVTSLPFNAAILQVLFGEDVPGSILTIPVFENGRRVQQLSFIWKEANRIDEGLQRFVETLQAQIVVVLKNQQYRNTIVKAVADSRQQVQILQQLNSFSQEIQSELQVERILAQVIEQGQYILPFDYLSVQAYYPESGLHEILHYENEASTILTPGTPIKIQNNDITRQVWATRTSLSFDDLSDQTLKHPLSEKIRSLVSSPVLAAGILRGILTIGHEQTGQYRALDVAAIEQMSGQIGVALANADTVARSQKVARNKALASEISTRLQQQPDLERMADITLQRLGRALGAKRARIRLGVDVPVSLDIPPYDGETDS
ncbi:MAG: GAF domain-containing protein, partial [Aggregatilineales bacterium]